MPDGTDTKLSIKDFAGKIRARYPGAYDHVPDRELAERVIRKYPVYADSVDLARPTTAQVQPAAQMLSPTPGQPSSLAPIARVPINPPVSNPPGPTFIGQPKSPEEAELQFTLLANREQPPLARLLAGRGLPFIASQQNPSLQPTALQSKSQQPPQQQTAQAPTPTPPASVLPTATISRQTPVPKNTNADFTKRAHKKGSPKKEISKAMYGAAPRAALPRKSTGKSTNVGQATQPQFETSEPQIIEEREPTPEEQTQANADMLQQQAASPPYMETPSGRVYPGGNNLNPSDRLQSDAYKLRNGGVIGAVTPDKLAGTYQPTKGLSEEAQAREALEYVGGLYGVVDPQKIDQFISQLKREQNGRIFVNKKYDPKAAVTVTVGDLQQIGIDLTRPGTNKAQLDYEKMKRVTAPPSNEILRQEAIRQLRQEKEAHNLQSQFNSKGGDVPVDPNPTEDEIRTRIAEMREAEPSQTAKEREYYGAQTAGAGETGLYSGVGSLYQQIGGALRPFGYGKSFRDLGAEMRLGSQYLHQGQGPQGIGENVVNFLGESVPQLAEMAIPGSVWIKFPLIATLQASGENKSRREIAGETLKGIGTAATFETANLFEKPIARLATVAGGSLALNTLSGDTIDQNIQGTLVNTAYELLGIYGKNAVGKTWRFLKGDRAYDIQITPKGVDLLKSNPNRKTVAIADLDKVAPQQFANAPRTQETLKPLSTNEIPQPPAQQVPGENVPATKTVEPETITRPKSELEKPVGEELSEDASNVPADKRRTPSAITAKDGTKYQVLEDRGDKLVVQEIKPDGTKGGITLRRANTFTDLEEYRSAGAAELSDEAVQENKYKDKAEANGREEAVKSQSRAQETPAAPAGNAPASKALPGQRPTSLPDAGDNVASSENQPLPKPAAKPQADIDSEWNSLRENGSASALRTWLIENAENGDAIQFPDGSKYVVKRYGDQVALSHVDQRGRTNPGDDLVIGKDRNGEYGEVNDKLFRMSTVDGEGNRQIDSSRYIKAQPEPGGESASSSGNAKETTQPTGTGNNPGEPLPPEQGGGSESQRATGESPEEKPDVIYKGRPAREISRDGDFVEIQYLDGEREVAAVHQDEVPEAEIDKHEVERVEKEYDKIAQSGHAVQRHGEHITPQQLVDRAVKGFDPVTGTTDDAYLKNRDGTPAKHRAGKTASKFNSKWALVTAEEAIRKSDNFNKGLKEANKSGDTALTIKHIRLEDIFGKDYKKFVSGVTRDGTKPLGYRETDFTDGSIRAVYKKDMNGHWNLQTIFPEPKK